MNTAGITDRFEFQESPGINRIAWLTETRFTTFGTHDAQWLINVSNATPGDWLTYLGTNDEQCRIAPHIRVWGENEKANGDDHNEPQGWFDIRDWSGNAWHVEFQDVHNAPVAPIFKLTRV